MVPSTCSVMPLDVGRCIESAGSAGRGKDKGDRQHSLQCCCTLAGADSSFAQRLESKGLLSSSEILMSGWCLTPKPQRSQTGHWLSAMASSAMQWKPQQGEGPQAWPGCSWCVRAGARRLAATQSTSHRVTWNVYVTPLSPNGDGAGTSPWDPST